MEPIDIRLVRRLRRAEVRRLYQEAGWWEERDEAEPRRISRLLAGTFLLAGAFAGGRLVGMARAISDGGNDAYIQDVIVRPACRGRGIGRRLVETLVAALQKKGIAWIGLIAVPGSKNFYRRLGFRTMPGHAPMLWKENE